MRKHTALAARASRAAAQTAEMRTHLNAHRKHRQRHETIALAGGALLGGDPDQHSSELVRRTIEEHGTRLPLTPKETAAIDSLIADHPDVPASLTRRDPGETGPVLASFGPDTYLVDGDAVTRLVG